MSRDTWTSARGCVFSTFYHLVWSTKYRRPVLQGQIAEALKAFHETVATTYRFVLHAQEVMPDHVHLFVSAHPKWSPSTLAKVFKGVTARWLFQRHPALKRSLWRGQLWNPSYYVGTAGNVTREAVTAYIETQRAR